MEKEKIYTTSERLNQIMEERNLKQIDILNLAAPYCKEYNIKLQKNDLSQYVSGKVEPKQDKLTVLGLALNVSEVWLMGYDVPMNRNQNLNESNINAYNDNLHLYQVDKIKLPLLGEIACGEPIFAAEDRESYVLAGTDIRADFCLKASGDSMINARINDGDIVFIRKQDQVNNGEIAAVIIDDSATLKRFFYYKQKGMVVLRAENSKYEDIILTGEELNNVRVLGKAVAFQSDVE